MTWQNFLFVVIRFFKDFYRRVALRLMAYSCDHILTISEKTKADILKLELAENEKKILFFYNNISTPSFDGEGKRIINQKYILYVAGFDYPSKNHLGFLKKIKDSNFSDLIIFAETQKITQVTFLK